MTPGGAAQLQVIDWVVIAAYLALALGVGVWVGRKSRGSMENFFLSGRNLPWYLAGTSMVATSFASDTPLVVTGWTRAGGVAGNWRWWGYAVSTMLVVVLFARMWQRSRVLTDVEFMELRYSGRPARALRVLKSVYQSIFVHCFIMGWVILGMTKVFVVLFDMGTEPVLQLGPLGLTPAWLVMLACCLLALLYSEVAGLWGVVMTDFVQFGVALAGSATLMVLVADHFGGFGGLVDALGASSLTAPRMNAAPDMTGISAASPSTWDRSVWEFAVFVLIVPFATKNADGGGVMIQRLLASKNERHAVGASLWYAVAHNAIRPWPWILVALASLLVLPPVDVASPVTGRVDVVDAEHVLVVEESGASHRVALPPAEVEGWRVQPLVAAGDEVVSGQRVAATDDERAYPMMMRRFLPAGLLGLLVASFLAAFMSTIDTHVNVATSYLVNDMYKRFMRRDAPPRHYVRAARVVGPLVLAIALAFAAASASVRTLFDWFSSLFSGLGVVYLLRWTWWRINAWSEITALATGALVTGASLLWPEQAARLLPAALVEAGKPVFPGPLLLVVAVALPVTIVVTLLTVPVEREHLQRFFDRVRPLGVWGPLRGGRDAVAGAGLRVVLGWFGALAFVGAAILLPGRLMFEHEAPAGLWLSLIGGGLLLLATLFRMPRHQGGEEA